MQVATSAGRRLGGQVGEPPVVRWALIALAVGFLGLFVALPVILVFVEALAKGPGAYLHAIRDPEALSAIRLTLLTASIVVPLNVGFGVCAAHLIARYDFAGRHLLVTLIDLPFSVSPVISGLI